MKEIILWDDNCTRLQAGHASLSAALKKLGIEATITCQSEPPLLSRMGLFGLGLTVEIDGNYWRCSKKDEVEPSCQNFIDLLSHLSLYNIDKPL